MRQRHGGRPKFAEPPDPFGHRAFAQPVTQGVGTHQQASAAPAASGGRTDPARVARIPAGVAHRRRSAVGRGSTDPSARWRCARRRRTGPGPSAASRADGRRTHRSTACPVICTLVPGAWPMISTRAVVGNPENRARAQGQDSLAEAAGERLRRRRPGGESGWLIASDIGSPNTASGDQAIFHASAVPRPPRQPVHRGAFPACRSRISGSSGSS